MATETRQQPFEPAGDKLVGKVAMVTGGTRGIGAGISRKLATQGASVAAGFAGNREKAEQFQAELSKMDIPVSLHQGNIGSPDDCRRTVQEVIDHHGRLDILVNNAGITADKTIFKLTDDDWTKVIAVNLSGAFFMSQAALRHMVERGTGRIINISSLIGEIGNLGQTNYAASKSGLFGLTMSMAREAAFALKKAEKLAGNDVSITVNAVTPGYIETEMIMTVPEKVRERICAMVPLNRLGKPEEVARVVHFLAADDSGYITGQVFAVNGGIDM